MVGNKKSMAQIAHDLIDFIGDESAEHFVAWLSGVLPTYEAQAAGDDAAPTASTTETGTAVTTTSEAAASAPETTAPAEATPVKRIISLKSTSASTDAAPKLVSLSASRGTVRSLSRAPVPSDDVLAKRSQRFGIVEKSPPPPSRKAVHSDDAPKALVSSAGAAKRKASAEPESSARRGSGGRLSQLLGPPVNVDQAELDARDSLHSNKKTKPNPRVGTEPERERRSRSNGRNDRSDRNNQENRDADSTNRKLTRRAEPGERPLRQGDAPPLPRSDRPERADKFGGRGNQQGGYFNGPPGFGGFPPPVRHSLLSLSVDKPNLTLVRTCVRVCSRTATQCTSHRLRLDRCLRTAWASRHHMADQGTTTAPERTADGMGLRCLADVGLAQASRTGRG